MTYFPSNFISYDVACNGKVAVDKNDIIVNDLE